MSPVVGDVSLNVMVASNISRNKQRNAEKSIHVSSEAAPTEFVEKQTHRDIRQSGVTIAENPEVVKSILSVECLSSRGNGNGRRAMCGKQQSDIANTRADGIRSRAV